MASFDERYPMPINVASLFSPAEVAEMRDNFAKFDENGDGNIDERELANILGIAGADSNPEVIAVLLAEADTNGDGKISFEEYVNMLYKTKKSGSQTQLSTVIKRAVGVVQTMGAGGATHTFSEEEKAAFATHINNCCFNDPLVSRHLPINPDSYELFTKCSDGLVFCKLINLAVPQTIDERAINKKNILSVYQKIENLNLVVNAAKGIGCQVVNIGAQDLIEGRPILILGLLWQIIRIQLLSMISLKEHPELVLLLEPGEDLATFMKLPPEEILLRWVNYHLKKANSPRKMTNFTKDIMDSVIYGTLTSQLDGSKCQNVREQDPLPTRAAQVIRNASALGASPFIQPRDICEGNKKLNVAFVAQLFNSCPGLYLDEKKKAEYDLSFLDIDDAGDSREERVFRMWMNSLNIEDMYINNLFIDLADGVNLLKVFDKVQPGSVNWKRVNKAPGSVFKKVENCNYAVEIARDTFKFSMVNIGGKDIMDGNKKLILAIIWQTMRKYTLQVLADLAQSQGISTANFNDDHVVNWANQKVATGGSNLRMKNLRDPSLSNSLFFLDLVAAVEPRAVERELIISNPQPCSSQGGVVFCSDDCMQNARYVITCARKVGACVFLTPEDICEVKPKMLLTFCASLWQCDLVRSGSCRASVMRGQNIPKFA